VKEVATDHVKQEAFPYVEGAVVYHAIVKRIAVKNFARVNDKDYNALLKDCAPQVYHRFSGDHALGGERHDREALRRWFDRLGHLSPTLSLTVHDAWVKGAPRNTTIVIRWSATQDMPDGSPYNNHGVHVVQMKWGMVSTWTAPPTGWPRPAPQSRSLRTCRSPRANRSGP
jgi:ketosteroid isomerase-like protein